MDRENSEIKSIKLVKIDNLSKCSCLDNKNNECESEISLDNYISNNVFLSYFNSVNK